MAESAERPGVLSAVRRLIHRRFDPRSRLGLPLTAGFLIVAGGIWLFSALLEEVLDQATLVRWDRAIAAAVHAQATPIGDHVFSIITLFGSPILWVVTIGVGLVLLMKGERLLLTAWVAAFAGGKLLEQLLKVTVHRTRPRFSDHYLRMHSFSFPSGHAMASLICYLMLAYVLCATWRVAAGHRVATFAAATVVVLAVGLSRVYLGVHFPSDVVGGYVAGGVWLGVCITFVDLARHPARG